MCKNLSIMNDHHCVFVGVDGCTKVEDHVFSQLLNAACWPDVPHNVSVSRVSKACLMFHSDLMDRLVDEAEGLADTTSSVCSVGASGRLEPSAEQQLGLLNSITASDLTGEPSLIDSLVSPIYKMSIWTPTNKCFVFKRGKIKAVQWSRTKQ